MVNDMENVLESIGVTKNYAGKAAVENVSLKLEKIGRASCRERV